MPVPQISMGPQGPMVSQIVYGTWRLADDDPSQATVESILARIDACLEVGITTFDLADIYGCYTYEELFGNALKSRPELRAKIQLITKTGIVIPSKHWGYEVYAKHYNTSKEHITSQVERSLKLLNTDYLDLVLIHRPDFILDADEVGRVMTDLTKSGKVRHWGVSNHTVHQFDLIQSRLDFPLVTNQIEFSASYMTPMEDGVLDQCQRLRISPMIWSPLGGGKLVSKNPQDEKTQRLQKALANVGSHFGGLSLDLVAFAWILRHPSNPVIILGTNNVERIKSVAVLFDKKIRLDVQQYYSVWEASKGEPVP